MPKPQEKVLDLFDEMDDPQTTEPKKPRRPRPPAVAPASRFPMYGEWEPSDTCLELLGDAGITVLLLPAISSFVMFWRTRPERQNTQEGWDYAFYKHAEYLAK